MPAPSSGCVRKQEQLLSIPNASDRTCKRKSELSQRDQLGEEHRDLCNDDPDGHLHTPTNQRGKSQESSHRTHRAGQIETGMPSNANGYDVTPDGSTALEEQLNCQRKQISGEQSDPAKTNNTSSQATEEGQASSDRAKRRKRGRRARRARKRKFDESMRNGQTAENGPSDLTGQGAAESRQATPSTTYYAITNGNYGYHGVHTDWDLCVRYLKGTCGATFKSFSSLDEAFEFAHGSGAPGETAPLKKMKAETQPRSTDRETEAPPPPENESQSLEESEPPGGFQPSDRGGCPSGEAAGIGQRVEPSRSDKGDRPPRRRRSKKKHKTSGADPSLEEIRPPKEVQPAEEIRSPKNVQPAEEIQLQEWKVEPVLLPSDLFSPEGNSVKREQTLIRMEPYTTGY